MSYRYKLPAVMSQPSTETAVDSFKTHKLLIQSIILPDNIDLPVDKLIVGVLMKINSIIVLGKLLVMLI